MYFLAKLEKSYKSNLPLLSKSAGPHTIAFTFVGVTVDGVTEILGRAVGVVDVTGLIVGVTETFGLTTGLETGVLGLGVGV
ncbi:MAG TPA: hypothetical protein PLS50_05000, partial [Candidatus Dojkabacteria bacterium]|nr:hypothetical protein [Candidatus Dojkabacteria bacterium]